MDFYINDAQALLSQTDSLATVNDKISQVREQLVDCCNQISNAWQSDTEDKLSYLSTTNYNLGKIEKLCIAIDLLEAKLRDFANQSISAANNGN